MESTVDILTHGGLNVSVVQLDWNLEKLISLINVVEHVFGVVQGERHDWLTDGIRCLIDIVFEVLGGKRILLQLEVLSFSRGDFIGVNPSEITT